MGLWSYYFFAKLFLYFGGFIGFHFWHNLGFAVFTLLPVRPRWARILKQLVAVPAGIALLYFDSWLPPFKRLLEQSSELSQFSVSYLAELIGRFLNPWVVVALALLAGAWWLLGRWLRMSSFAILGVLAVPVVAALPHMHFEPPSLAGTSVADATPAAIASPTPAPATDQELNATLASFYKNEALRQVSFMPTESPFDIVIVQICSLAWDDLNYAKQQDHSLMSRFDILFDNFNSGASYSGPAAIRLLRGGCGQEKHSDLYRTASPGCYAFNGLQQAGFQPQFLMNHDGHFGDFIGDVRTNGGLNVPPTDNRSAPVVLRAFDDTPIYDDFALLNQWWQSRLALPAPRVALYYNTVSLHDGNHYPDRPNASSRDTYPQRAKELLDNVDKFLDTLDKSGRPVVVVFVPEHGAAIRGDRLQIPGLREIPSPAITRVPVGIKLVGRHDPVGGGPVRVQEAMSYQGLYELLARFIAKNPFETTPAVPLMGDYLRNLPQTESVAENEDNVVMRIGARYLMRNLDLTWTEYPAPAP